MVAASFALAHLVALTNGPLSDAARHHLHQGLLGWDAERYTDIATHGYAQLPLLELRFFPLVPLLTRALAGLPLVGPGLALVALANGAALVFGALVHALCMHERGDARLARRATWFVAFTPAAFVLVWGYSEAVWGCLAVGMLLALRRRSWAWAAVLGLLAGLTRPVGPLLVLPALIEVSRSLRYPTGGRSSAGGRWDTAARAAAVLAPLAGTGAYLAWAGAHFGDPLLPYRIQQRASFRGDLSDPVTPLLHAVAGAVQGGIGIDGVRVLWAVAMIVLVVATCRSWPASYAALAGATVAVALATARLGSFERYGFGAFPVVIHLAAIATTRRRAALLLAVGATAMAAYCTLAFLGRFVP